MTYQVGKVYQNHNKYNSLFKIVSSTSDGIHNVYCMNGGWDGVYDEMAQTLYIPVGKRTINDFYLVKPYEDIGYGYMDQDWED